MASTKLAHSKHPHVTLDCGHKVCSIDGINATRGSISPAHVRELERFHAQVHRIEAAKRKSDAKRSALADGKIEGLMGGRLTPRQVIAQYEREKAKANRHEEIKSVLGAYLGQSEMFRANTKKSIFPLKSKFVGKSRRKIPAGYRPRRVSKAVPMTV